MDRKLAFPRGERDGAGERLGSQTLQLGRFADLRRESVDQEK